MSRAEGAYLWDCNIVFHFRIQRIQHQKRLRMYHRFHRRCPAEKLAKKTGECIGNDLVDVVIGDRSWQNMIEKEVW